MATYDPSKLDGAISSEHLEHVLQAGSDRDSKNSPDGKPDSNADISRIAGTKLNRWLGSTPGERKFNKLDWFGVNYGLNSAISIYASDVAHNGWLHTFYQRMNEKLSNTFLFQHRPEGAFSEHDRDMLDAFQRHARQHLIDDNVVTADAARAMSAADVARALTPDDLIQKLGQSNKNAFISTAVQNPLLRHLNLDNLPKLEKEAAQFMNARNSAKLMTGFTLLGVGGWLLIAPVKWLEDRKASLVTHFDDQYIKSHNVTAAEVDAIDVRHKEIKKEPKQSWSSVFLSRATTYPLIIAAYLSFGPGKGSNWISRAATHVNPEETGLLGHVSKYNGSDVVAERWANKTVKGFNESDFTKDLTRTVEPLLDKGPLKWHEKRQASDDRFANSFVPRSGHDRLKQIVGNTYTEMVYSLGMATMTFIASRILGPIFGDAQHRHHKKHAAPIPVVVMPDKLPASLVPQVAAYKEADGPTSSVSEMNYAGKPGTDLDKRDVKENRDTAALSAAQKIEPALSHRERVETRFDGEPARI